MSHDLIENLAAPDLWARIAASAALRDAGESALEPLCAIVTDANAPFECRWRAALLLGEAGDARAVQPLLRARHDAALDLRQSAIWALGCLGDATAFAALVDVFTDPAEEEQLRFITAAALTNIDAERAIPLLRAALDGKEAQQRAAHAWLATLANRERST